MTSATIPVRVQPRARREEIVAIRDGVLVVRVAAPALDGRANDALCRLIAKQAGVRASSVTIVRGHRARDKLLRIEGIEQTELESILG
jgi:uncharacterized protein (TIGR00251 family)